MRDEAAYRRELRARKRALGLCRECHRVAAPYTRCVYHRQWFQAYKFRSLWRKRHISVAASTV